MAVTITHTTPADGTFSATGAAAWDANHAVSGLGTMAEQNANSVNITGGSLSGVTNIATSSLTFPDSSVQTTAYTSANQTFTNLVLTGF